SRDVAVRPSEARHELELHGIGREHHHDRNGRRGLLRGRYRGIVSGDDDVDLEPYELSGELRKSLSLSAGLAPFHDDVLTLGVTELAQAVAEGLVGSWAQRVGVEHADPRHLRRSLRLDGGCRDEEYERQGSGTRHDHSITCLARAPPH